jgi:tetratricopeptide (TPR) repeat protein
MKRQRARERRTSTYPARHQLDHAVPTVIHDPEQKMTALGRWTHRIIQQPRKQFGVIATVVGLLAIVVVAWNLVGLGSSRTSEVWAKLENTKKADERVTLARENPESPAATWALLQAATELYNQALADMPNNRDVAQPLFRRALDLFDEVARDSPKDSPQARAGALGKARALEARNELDRAIEQYELVGKTWPGTAEADQAAQFAEELKRPEARQFYKDLFAYAPTKVTLPGYGTEKLDSPLTSGSGTGSPLTNPSGSPLLPELPLELPPAPREVKAETPRKAELPQNVFSGTKSPATKK